MTLKTIKELAFLSSSSIQLMPERYVKLPWQSIFKETNISPERFMLQDSICRYVPAQVFQVDRDDPSHDFLIVSLSDTAPNPEEVSKVIRALRVKERELGIQNRGFPRLEVVLGPNNQTRGVKLASDQLSVWFNLIPAPGDHEKDWNWYAGSATSVLLNNQEMLEYFTNDTVSTTSQVYWMRHDPQKRCMQVDKIRVWDKIHNTWSKPYDFFDQPFDLISHSIGSLGVSITIASTPFNYGKGEQYRLYRIISLFKNADYFQEQLFVRKTNIKPGATAKDDYLEFKAHYFTFMDLSFRPVQIPILIPDLMEHPSLRQGFAMVSSMPPYPAYGFMCNTEHKVTYPCEDFPEWPNKYKTFSWELSGCKSVECIHRLGFADNTLPELFSKIDQWQALPW